MDEVSIKRAPKASWRPTGESFNRFLKFLDDGTESNGRSYLEMQRRLVGYFTRKGCAAPEDLADETLNRVARRLEEEGAIDTETPARFCYITARFVFLEHRRYERSISISAPDSVAALNGNIRSDPTNADERVEKEKMLACLDECTAKLNSADRELIVRYYYGQQREKIENRRAIARRLGISINAVSIRACRIRSKLEACVLQCAMGK